MTNTFAYMRLFVSLYNAKRGNARLARIYLDRALKDIGDKLAFVPAYNARILMMEGRHQEAKELLESVSKTTFGEIDSDEKYIHNYCQFHIELYKKNDDARIFKREAMSLNPRNTVKNFLPFLSDDAISRILN